MDEYKTYAQCLNCGFKGSVKVLKGKAIKTQSCPNCQCVGMEVTAEPEIPKMGDKRVDLKKEEPAEEEI
jgi:hypothetical protein